MKKYRLPICSFLVVLVLSAIAQDSFGSSYNLGLIGSKTYPGGVLRNGETGRYSFATAKTAESDSSIYVRYLNTGGDGYNIDLYGNSTHLGSTSVPSLQYQGGRFDLGDGTSMACLGIPGLPKGAYTVVISRSSLLGSDGPYFVLFTLPEPPATGGNVGGGATGAARAAILRQINTKKKVRNQAKTRMNLAIRKGNRALAKRLKDQIDRLDKEIERLQARL